MLRRRLPVLLLALLVVGTAIVAVAVRNNDDGRSTDVRTGDDPDTPTVTSPIPTSTTIELNDDDTATTLTTTATTLPTAPPALPERPSPPIVTTSTTAKPKPAFGATPDIQGPGIYVANVDGTNLRRLSTELSGYPVWSPDGTRLAYVTGTGPNLIVQSIADGTKRTVATNAVVARDGPSWDATGTYLAYPGSSSGTPDRDAYVVPADGSAPPTQIAAEGDDATVAFAPRGGLLATMSDRGLFVMQRDGGDRRRLSDKPFNYGELRWSPDATRIATIPTSTANHLVIDVDAPNAELAIGGPNTNMRIDAGVWSPDGTRLVIEGYRNDVNTFGTWFASATDPNAPPTLISSNHGDPDWSSATNTIVTVDQNKWAIALTTGGDPATTVNRFERGGSSRAIANPHLSPDGRQLAFSVYR